MLCLFCGTSGAGELEISGGGVADFGSYSALESRSHSFRLTNRTDSAITLKSVRSTCACLTGEVNNRKLLPGESFELPATIAANSVAGKFSKVLYLEIDRPDRRFLRLELKGEARPPVAVSPGTMFYAGKLLPGKQYEFRFELTPDHPGISISTGKEGDCTLERRENGWLLICRVTPKENESVVERSFRIDIDAPAGTPPVRISIRGNVERRNE
ncbi:hypothetical protein SDC9_94068 [bioreactor metagenome]|uniref:DUF1573 domain-containing protein n=1 Tax=bioreactor metagenome TaxID=1076179 RepID=A0A645A2D2_9ZZZZ